MLFRQQDFPNLNDRNHHDIVSDPNGKYNCIAWAAGIDNEWWEPVSSKHWPANAPRDCGQGFNRR